METRPATALEAGPSAMTGEPEPTGKSGKFLKKLFDDLLTPEQIRANRRNKMCEDHPEQSRGLLDWEVGLLDWLGGRKYLQEHGL